MANTLVLFAHPALERSRINRSLIVGIEDIQEVTFRDLYQLYPDFDIDVASEQEQLLMHKHIVWQFPMYWYSVPPLLKQWIDLTLEHGWAYGSRGVYLKGKTLHCVVTTGGGAEAYEKGGLNNFTVEEFLRPLEQTARLCGMDYKDPLLIQGTHSLVGEGIRAARQDYRSFLQEVSSKTT